MESAVKSLGVSYTRCEWPPEHNGIDDYYLAQLAENPKAA
jgi:hypothetical protein